MYFSHKLNAISHILEVFEMGMDNNLENPEDIQDELIKFDKVSRLTIYYFLLNNTLLRELHYPRGVRNRG